MAEILKEWLEERLQRPISWRAEEFGHIMKNGQTIANILLTYNVINEEKFYLITETENKAAITVNWKYISQWLQEIEIHLSESEIADAIDGKNSTLLRLFYQLFLHLDKRDRINFIKSERKKASELISKLNTRFEVEQVKENELSYENELSKPLLNEKHYIQWQKEKAAEVKETFDFIRHKYSKILSKLNEKHTCPPLPKKKRDIKRSPMERDIEQFALKDPCQFKSYTYEELLQLEEEALKQKPPLVDSEWVKNYLDNLHDRFDKKSDSKEFQNQMRNSLSNSMWEITLGEAEEKLDTETAEKVMKLCHYEKKMCTQLMEAKQQARNLLKNKIEADNEFQEQRCQQFDQFLDSLKQKMETEVNEIAYEKKRQAILHQRLYTEKMKRKRQHYYEICYETMLALADYASKYAYYKILLDGDIPDHFIKEWKNLFFKMQPIYEILSPVEEVLTLQESVAEEEDITKLDEMDRQEVLNQCDFDEYHNYIDSWTLENLIPNFDPGDEERMLEYLGRNILGHVVYTLLEIKYPYPPPRKPANLPDYTVKALIKGLPDKSITKPMQQLLDYRKIFVARLETAINYCLQKFKTEMIGCKDIALAFDHFIAAATLDEDKDLIRSVKEDSDNIERESSSILLGPILPNTKQTQTPKTLPEDDIVLSDAAELGRYAYEALAFGETLTDHLVCAILVEFIKDQPDKEGFVLINYPRCYREACILEEAFTGIMPPHHEELDDIDDLVYLEESIIKHVIVEKDLLKEFRISKLVENPHKRDEDKPFNSYFTCYINLKETPDLLKEDVIWDLDKDNSDLIDRFYASLGLNYSMYYEVIDKEVLFQICKYIIGELLPEKSYYSLFGSDVSSRVDFFTIEDRCRKSKIMKPELSSLSVGKSKQKLSSKAKMESSNTKIEEAKEHSHEEEHNRFAIEELKEEQSHQDFYNSPEIITPLLPGCDKWEYGRLPIPESLGISLASLWEQIEKAYLTDLHQLFLAKRLQMYCLVPYTRFIKDKMEQIISMPTHKQDYVETFQRLYNGFENDWRDYTLTRNEWHCRVKLLQEQLYDICDNRKILAQKLRQDLIHDNWVADELVSMANTYISLMQAELNRHFLTLQIFEDFYNAMLKGNISSDRVTPKELTKIFRDYDDSSGRKTGEDKVYRQLKAFYLDLFLKDITVDNSNNPLIMIVENNVKLAFKIIKDANDAVQAKINKENLELLKQQPLARRKTESESTTSVSPEEILRTISSKCMEEWRMGVNGEMYRAMLRILAIQYKCYHDLKMFSSVVNKAFTDIQNNINTYYSNEIKAVERLCKYLQLAIENGRLVLESLILDRDKFWIDPNLLQFAPSVLMSDHDDLGEMPSEFNFSVAQIARLCSQFRIVAPTGLILEQAFIYVLQDFIVFGKEASEGPLFPNSWRRINPEEVPKLTNTLFGENIYTDWRDFLIACLNIRFPTMDELLEIRKKYRCSDPESCEQITRENYLEEKLWFEDDFDIDNKYDQLRRYLIKNFLFELFATSVEHFNYSAFLLAFCKSFEPLEGFAAALSMAVGKKICYKNEECEDVVNVLIEDKKYKDACLACAHKCAEVFIDTLITKVIDYCEGITITELEGVSQDIKVGKKGQKHDKGKKGDDRSKLAKGTSKKKTSTSENDVKTTFICKPCDEPPVELEESKPSEEEEVATKEIPTPDPNLAYAVSQDVIRKILSICIPWYFSYNLDHQYKDEIEEVLRDLQNLSETGDIYVCKFFSNVQVCKILNKVKKYTLVNLAEEIFKLNNDK